MARAGESAAKNAAGFAPAPASKKKKKPAR